MTTERTNEGVVAYPVPVQGHHATARRIATISLTVPTLVDGVACHPQTVAVLFDGRTARWAFVGEEGPRSEQCDGVEFAQLAGARPEETALRVELADGYGVRVRVDGLREITMPATGHPLQVEGLGMIDGPDDSWVGVCVAVTYRREPVGEVAARLDEFPGETYQGASVRAGERLVFGAVGVGRR